MRIKIIRVPQGRSPFSIRQKLVGLVLHAVTPPQDGIVFDGRTDRFETYFGGVSVDVFSALAALEKKSPKAAQWYCDHLPPVQRLHLLPGEYIVLS